jgi:signal transduction histidine kinase
MSDTVDRRRRYVGTHADPLLAAVLTITAVVVLASQGELAHPASLCLLAFCALVAVRRWHPVFVALVAGTLSAVPYFVHDAAAVYNNGSFIPVWAAIFLYSYTLGSSCPVPASVFGVTAILVGVNLSGGPWNPVPEMVAIGPWLGGVLVASRRRASEQLEVRAKELEEEREIFAEQSVRYERARIARELHDVVAHNVSLMVVQANAGERLTALDPESAAQAFAAISEAARQAEDEIERLVELLSDTGPASPSAGLRIVEELVQRARASGLAISCQLGGDIDDLTDRGADAAYRLVQEGITNAMKHAPGAPMDISVQGQGDGVEVRVANGPAMTGFSGLERAGGGHGLAGMRERVVQCGGTFDAGATTDGGWQVTARLPRHASRIPSRTPGPATSPGF